MITRFDTQSPVDSTPLSGMIYTPDNPVTVLNLVHGFGEHCGRYAHMMDALGQHGIATCALDLRGHGRSGGKRGVSHKYENLREDVEALLSQSQEHFTGLPHFLYGHSMGGGLVLNYVLTRGSHNLHGVMASAPLLTLPTPTPKVLEMTVRLLRKIAPDMTINNVIDGTKISTLSEEQKAYEADPLNHGKLGVGLAVDLVESGEWVLSNAQNWALPLLLMHAKNDKLTAFSGTKVFAQKAKNCTFHAFDNVEHEIHNDSSRADVYAAMNNFIKDHQ